VELANPEASRRHFVDRPSDWNAAGLPEQINDQQDHLWLDWVFVAREGIHQVVRQRIDKQKACEQESSALSITNREP
jgi:hypothetical protein